LIILSLFRNKIKNKNVYVLSTYTALFVSVVTVLNDMGIGSSIGIPIVATLPFANLGFNWVVPVLAAGIIGSLVPATKEL